jgi:hypothetical protein
VPRVDESDQGDGGDADGRGRQDGDRKPPTGPPPPTRIVDVEEPPPPTRIVDVEDRSGEDR